MADGAAREAMRTLCLRDGAWDEADDAAGARLTWVRAGGATQEQLAEVGRRYGLHPLALEDVQTPRQRPKVEEYGKVVFTVVRVPRLGDDDVSWQQVGLWLGPDWVVSASTAPVPELDEVERRLRERGLPPERTTACFLFYRVLDAIVDAWFPFVDQLEEWLEELEDGALEEPSRETLASIRDAKHLIASTRKVSTPMREAAMALERGDHEAIADATRVYLRDVSDHMVRITERLEHVRESGLIAQETWNSTLANRQNETMRRLTVVAALLLVPGLIAGLGGMNFPGVPDWPFWNVVAVLLSLVGTGFLAAYLRGWL